MKTRAALYPKTTTALRSSSGQAFTRTDLLTLFAMLALLAALNLAAVTNNRAGSEATTCLANLRDLTRAWQQYATEEGHFPPNPDDGNTTPGRNWVPGQAGAGGAQEFNPDILQSGSSLLYPYLGEKNVAIYRCPADRRQGKYQGSDPLKRGTTVLAARSYSMNVAVGINPDTLLATDGAWLDNAHSHVRGTVWRTYANFDDVLAPTPVDLSVLFDEDGSSLNDGVLAFGMQQAEWIDWPAARHDMGGTISFADGHVQLKHWLDERTAVLNQNVNRKSVPGSADYDWLRNHISAPIHP